MNAVKKFEYEIDSIFEKVYSVNESITTLERKALIQGFEDGLNEGLGSWLGRNLGKATSFFKSLPDRAKGWYQTGKKYATQALNWLKDLAGKIIDGIKTGFNKAVNWCTTNFKAFTEWCSKTYDTAVEGIKTAWNKFSGAVSDFSEWCVDFWNKLVAKVKDAVKTAKEKIIALGESISKWVSESWQTIREKATIAMNSTIAGFKRLGEIVMNGLSEGLKKAGQISAAVLLVVAWPFTKLLEMVKKIPSLWQKLVKIISDYINSEIEDFKRAYGEEMDRYYKSKLDKLKTTTSNEIEVGPKVDLSLPDEPYYNTELSDEEVRREVEAIKKRMRKVENHITKFDNYSIRENVIRSFRNFKK